MAFRGLDVRESGDRIVFRQSVLSSSGNKLTNTTTLTILELQSDGTYKTYDFNDNTFKTTACTTATVNMVQQTYNNGGTDSGIHTYVLSTLTGFTDGNIYVALTYNSSGGSPYMYREFQYGSGALADVVLVGGSAQSATDLKDFADTGYDPSTHKVQGVVLTDTCTTNSDMRGTDGANTTVPDAAGTAAALHATTDGKIDLMATAADLATTDGKVDLLATAAALATTDGKVDLILEDTDELQKDDIPSALAEISGTLGGIDACAEGVASITSAIQAIVEGIEDIATVIGVDTGTTIPAMIAALNNLSSAQVQAAALAAITAYGPPTNAQMEARTLLAASYATAAALTSVAADITLARKLLRNRKEFDLDNSIMYVWNDAGSAREYSAALTDSDGAAVTVSTTGPINTGRWTAV